MITQHILKPYIIPGNESSPEKSIAWWHSLLMRYPENSAAMTGLGTSFYYGIGTPQDKTAAISYFKAAAALEDADAMYCLGLCLLTGDGITADPEEGIRLIKNAAFSDDFCDGHIYALLTLAECLTEGIGIPCNRETAAARYIDAVRPFISHNGEEALEDITCPPDTAETLLKAALLGSSEALAHFSNLPQAESFFEKRQEDVHTLISLGLKDAVSYLKDAPEDFLKKAEDGNVMMKSAVGFLYSWGYFAEDARRYHDCYRFGQPDRPRAEKWLSEAAGEGYGPAAYRLYRYYLKEDQDEAVTNLEIAASCGDLKACYELGRYYLDEEMEEEADKWLMKAAAAGYKGLDEDLLVEYYYDNYCRMNDRESGISDELITLWCRNCIDRCGFLSKEAVRILDWLAKGQDKTT